MTSELETLLKGRMMLVFTKFEITFHVKSILLVTVKTLLLLNYTQYILKNVPKATFYQTNKFRCTGLRIYFTKINYFYKKLLAGVYILNTGMHIFILS